MDEVDEFLSHHGIKGMHWGVRRNLNTGNKSRSSSKPTTQQIHDARIRTQARINQQKVHFDKLNTATTEAGRKRAILAIDKIGKEGAQDAAIADMSTRGEKVARAALLSVGGTIILAGALTGH